MFNFLNTKLSFAEPISYTKSQNATIDFKKSELLNPFLYPRIGLFLGMDFNPEELFLTKTFLKPNSPASGGSLIVDIPVTSFYSSGFSFGGYLYEVEGSKSMYANKDKVAMQLTLNLLIINHFFYDINLGKAGVIGGYLGLNLGPSLLLLDSFINKISNRDGRPIGAGLRAEAVLGIEYYPIQRFGLFAEGGLGYSAWWQTFLEDYSFKAMQMYSPIFQVGLKIVS